MNLECLEFERNLEAIFLTCLSLLRSLRRSSLSFSFSITDRLDLRFSSLSETLALAKHTFHHPEEHD